ncbi:MAG: hypothetical protein CVU03_10555 [Bacteroidetes bacterium HGW-Bacteroidetes-2]|jgi:hypothetical protein|nr:MAG: hypothetical protein CVU03_10555 [Bacteroidetes bacterium HGW-Bacteroidetes-2]
MLAASATAQQFLVEGEVFSDPGEDVESVQVFNLSTSKGTLTNKEGKFTLAVSLSDTLFVSALQFQKITVVITLEHYVSKKIKVALKSTTNELDAILIKRHSLTGNLEKDAKSIKTAPQISALSLGIIDKEIIPLTQSERRLYTATTGGGTVPFDPIINAITGRTKMLKMHIELDKDKSRIERLLETFNESKFTQELNIEADFVYDFLFFCEAHPSYLDIIKKDKISIVQFLKSRAQEYHKLKSDEK